MIETNERFPEFPERLAKEELRRRFSTDMGWTAVPQTKPGEAVFALLWEASLHCSDTSVVLDISAGQCRYKAFFAHSQYLAIDSGIGNPKWDYSKLDLIGDAHALPIHSETIDVGLNFTSLEHYTNPAQAFSEFYRVLKPGGHLFLYVPFTIAEHEIPYDFFRYTRYGLAYLCKNSGLEIRSLRPSNSLFETALSLVDFGLSMVPPEIHNRMNPLLDRTLRPLFRSLDHMEGAAQEYPKAVPIPQMPNNYCLHATKPGDATVSERAGSKRALLERIATCPICRTGVLWEEQSIVCANCNRVFPVQKGKPNLMVPVS